MLKTLKIGKKDYSFKSSAMLPVRYREATNREFFKDVRESIRGNHAYTFDIAYTMWVMANPDETVDCAEWLDSFEFMDLYERVNDIIGMITGTMETHSESKKNKGK